MFLDKSRAPRNSHRLRENPDFLTPELNLGVLAVRPLLIVRPLSHFAALESIKYTQIMYWKKQMNKFKYKTLTY